MSKKYILNRKFMGCQREYLYPLLLFFLSVFFVNPMLGQVHDFRFTVVIDAGHGGHDAGALGLIGIEKDINLEVSLKLGALIEKNFSDVKVVYTRKTDKYLTLQERADIVNSNHADLFICVHTNSAQSSTAYGAETFTLGLAKTKANLDVAMRENSVILLEDDYKSKYKGFDPSSVDSYIMFEFMQDKYIDKSIDFASGIQHQFVNFSKRSDRGVRQAGFWVLHRSACPSVLVELGFISNREEERFLTSQHGQNIMASAIYNAFVSFKRDYDKKSGRDVDNVRMIESDDLPKSDINSSIKVTKIENQVDNNVKANIDSVSSVTDVSKVAPLYKIQLLVSKDKLKTNSSRFKGLVGVDYYFEEGLYKYVYGAEASYDKIMSLRKEILQKFPDAFVIAFVRGKKYSAKEVLKLIK